MARLVALVLFAACGKLHFDVHLRVEPVYASAPDWNDWIRNSQPDRPAWDQPEVACAGSETGMAACLHAGELRRVATGFDSCAGLAIRDTLDAFQWTCVDDGASVTLYATGLRPGRGLRDLVDRNGWRADAVEVRGGSDFAASDPEVWWTNPVIAAPTDNASVTLADPGAIYVVADTMPTSGYLLDADRLAFVVLRDATLVGGTFPDTNCDEATGPGKLVTCMIVAGPRQFVWLEGDIDANFRADYDVLLRGTRFVRMRGVRVASTRVNGLYLLGLDGALVSDVVAVNAANFGLGLYDLHDSVVSGLTVANNGFNGNPGANGLYMQAATGNVLTRVLAANNVPYGLLPYTGATGNTLAHLTVASNAFDGLMFHDAGNVAAQVVAVNQPNFAGVELEDANRAALVISANNMIGVRTDVEPPGLSSALLVGSNAQADCTIWQNAAFVASCSALAPAVMLTTGLDLTGSLRANVTTDDSVNASDNAGAAMHDAITDWFRFETPSRTWGADGAWPGSADMCRTTCRIWDWRRTPGDTMLVAHDRNGAPSDEPFVAGMPCPPRLDGDNAAVDAAGRAFLLQAIELIGDGRGNDDGLCQDGETCLDMRTAGAHRDEPTAWTDAACAFHDGMVHGVDMRGMDP